jgi:S-adenosylmethionine synthetase
MNSNIVIEHLSGTPVSKRRVEIVERKGLGHPDSICDAVAEAASISLARHYRDTFGGILHYNLDKGFLAAGKVERRLGGGEVLEPMRLIMGDRATARFRDQKIPIQDIVIRAAREWIRDHLRFVDPERHCLYQIEIREGSAELQDIFGRGGPVLGSNDSSAAKGYAPLSDTERMVLETEWFLNSPEFKASFPETGEDVKVMGVRKDLDLMLNIAVPLIDRFISSGADYFDRKKAIRKRLEEFLRSKKMEFRSIEVSINALDDPDRGMGGMYLSVLGTSAEDADSGQVGRGNRVNGIISLSRGAAAEAAPGKNAVSHVGKIYSVLSHELAHKIYDTTPGIQEIYVSLFNQIGAPIDRPRIVSIEIRTLPGAHFESIARKSRETAERELQGLRTFCEDLVQGRYPVW